ncbi:MAG: hypothetical protein RR060_08785, partial [Victivallaceae bacterium]
KAQQALSEAKKAQQEKDAQKAEEKLNEAKQALNLSNAEENSSEDKSNKSDTGESEKNQSGKENSTENSSAGGEAETAPELGNQKEQNISPEQAARLLESLGKDENELRKRFRQYNRKLSPVAKDW